MVRRVAPSRRLAAVPVEPKPKTDPQVAETKLFLTTKLESIEKQKGILLEQYERQRKAKQYKDKKATIQQLSRLEEEKFQATKLLGMTDEYIIPVAKAERFIITAGREREGFLKRQAYAKRQEGYIKAGEYEKLSPKLQRKLGVGKSEPEMKVTITETPAQMLAPPSVAPAIVVNEQEGFFETRISNINKVIGQVRDVFSKSGGRSPTGLFGFAEKFSPSMKKERIVAQELKTSTIRGTIPKDISEAKQTALIAGVSAGIGAVSVGVTTGAAKVSPKLAPVVSQIGGLGLAGFGGSVFKSEIEEATGFRVTPQLPLYKTKIDKVGKKDAFQISESLGGVARRSFVAGAGFGAGAKVAEIGLSGFRSGRILVPLEQISAKAQGEVTIPRGATVKSELEAFQQPLKPLGETTKEFRGSQARPLEVESVISKGKVRGGELIGGFFGTKFNPQFLRMGKEFGLDFGLPGGLPTFVRSSFEKGIKPTPGLKSITRLPTRSTIDPVAFSEAKAGTGEVFLPGTKSEREVVAIFGGKQFETGREFYTKVGGVKVPIVQTKITGTGAGKSFVTGAKEFRASFGGVSSPTGVSSIATSLGLGRFSVGRSTRVKQTEIIGVTPKRTTPRRRKGSTIVGTDVSVTDVTTTIGGTTISRPIISKTSIPGSSVTSVSRPSFTSSVVSGPRGFGAGLPFYPKARKKKPKRRFRRTPSFAAAVLNIRDVRPGKLEFTGLVERPIIR